MTGRRRPRARHLAARVFALLALLMFGSCLPATAEDDPAQARLKAAFVFNFALFTEWPTEVGRTLTICVGEGNPLGSALDALQGREIGARHAALRRVEKGGALQACQVVLVDAAMLDDTGHVPSAWQSMPALTIAAAPGAATQGAMLTMSVVDGKIAFRANVRAAKAARLTLNSKLLRLALEVVQ